MKEYASYTTTERKPIPSPSEQAKERRRNRILTPLALIGIGAAAFVGIVHHNNESRVGSEGREFTHSPNITSVVLENGANFRSDPFRSGVESSNLLAAYDSSRDSADVDATYLTVETPEGVNITLDNNGTWYGISVEDLSTSGIDVDATGIADDKDGIVWVNEQRATPTISDTESE